MPKQIVLNAFYMAAPSQSWPGLWAHPKADGEHYCEMSFWHELARTAERGLLDCVFFADSLGALDVYQGKPDALMRSAGMYPINDPFMLIPAMASVTENLCFGVTGNTTYEPPYLLARRFSTLDHLIKGRIGWNIVTGVAPSIAAAMGQKPTPHDQRYEFADDYMDLVYKLWEGSWEDGAALHDKKQRVFTDPSKVHKIRHAGKYYSSEAVHMCEPSPQRTPYLIAAGASKRGIDFAGRHAEATFMLGNDMEYSRQVVADYRKAAVANGRRPEDIKVLNAATVIVAATAAEARDLKEQCQEYSSLEGNLAMLSAFIGIDLSKYGPDEPIEHVESNAIQSILEAMTKFNKGGKVTPRILARFDSLPGREAFIVGTPSQVRDTMIKWTDEVGIDGFNLVRTVEPGGLKSFVDLVIPELQERGYFKTGYTPGSMREKMRPGRGARLADDHYAARFRATAAAAA